MKQIVFSQDPYGMNWLRPDYQYADIICPDGLSATVENSCSNDIINTTVKLTNTSGKPYLTHTGAIGIGLPFNDTYEESTVSLKQRCHTHIYCGGHISYVIGLRMGGEAPHLGLVFVEGHINHYSIIRDFKHESNDRGCFYLNPGPMTFDIGETKTISWVIFPHKGMEDFFNKAGQYRDFVQVKADSYVLFPGETCKISITPSFNAKEVKVDQKVVPLINGKYEYEFKTESLGEKTFEIDVDHIHTYCSVFVQESLNDLAKKRIGFIVNNQQYNGSIKQLQGAYLVYDNEDKTQIYSKINDHNACRERIGMSILIARYLQENPNNQKFVHSLEANKAFVLREVVHKENGRVCNDIGHDDTSKRLYNYPWYALFFIELYHLNHQLCDLQLSAKIIKMYYKEGGVNFYPIELPVNTLINDLVDAGLHCEAKELTQWFIKHGNQIRENGLNYPKHEVNYEQSIVAPAADILLKVYNLTKDQKYLDAAKEQVAVLSLFNGMQPDYHLNEVAIRHWDGFWFGKRRLYGDTFPHYWSALTGNVFLAYGKATNDPVYIKRGQNSLKGVLSLFSPNGKAACSYMYPLKVNEQKGKYYDEYANDQDWGLYFNLRNQ